MDRRLFLTGLLGVAGTAALSAALPRQAHATIGDPLEHLRPPRSDEMPEWDLAEEPDEEGVKVAQRGEWRPPGGGRSRSSSRRRGRRHGRRRDRRSRRSGRRRHRHRRHYRRYRPGFRYWGNDTLLESRCRWVVNRWGEWVRRCYRPPFGFGIWF